jgi:lambda family phage portal protein
MPSPKPSFVQRIKQALSPRPSATQRAERAAWLERTITAQVQRLHMHEVRSSAFDAGETPHYTDGWDTTDPNLNDALATRLGTLRGRAKGLARNNEWARRFLWLSKSNVLGPAGITMHMGLETAPGVADEATNSLIETGWWRWGKRGVCDITGTLTWRQIETLCELCLQREGEYLVRLVTRGPHGLQLHVLNPAVLDVNLRGQHQGRRIRMGVEINDEGAPVAYWLITTRPGDDINNGLSTSGARHTRVPADEIIHGFDKEEPDQLRGYPALTVGAQRLWLLKDFEVSAAVASSNSAKRQGFFFTPTGESPSGFADTLISTVIEEAKAEGRVLSAEEMQALQEAASKFNTLMPGQFDTLPHGVQFQKFDSNYPNVDYGDYIKACVRGFSAGLGMSYATVGNDLESVNYSSARVGIIDEREVYKLRQADLIDTLHQRVAAAWLARALLAYRPFRVLSTARLEEYVEAMTWQPRRWVGIDPAKEANAHETNLRLRLTSRRRIMRERGEDPADIEREIAAEEALYGPLDAENMPAPVVDPEDDEEQPAQQTENQPNRGRIARLRA